MPVKKAFLGWPGGDTPGELSFSTSIAEPEKQFIFDSIKDFLDSKTTIIDLFALTPPDQVLGRYQLKTEEGDWFLKIGNIIGHPSLEKQVCDFLIDQKVSINPLIYTGDTQPWNGQKLRIDIKPFIKGRHFDLSADNDLAALAKTLSHLHRALRQFNNQKAIQEIAATRNHRLKHIKNKIKESIRKGDFSLFAEHKEWAEEHKEWLTNMAKEFNPNFHEHHGAQCVHGEIHPGNVIFHDQKAILIDFEESLHVFAPTSWDLSYLIQRFCLQDEPDHNTLNTRLKCITESYGEKLPDLRSMMQQIAWFAMAVILDIRVKQNIVSAQGELDKFVRLERQASSFTN